MCTAFDFKCILGNMKVNIEFQIKRKINEWND